MSTGRPKLGRILRHLGRPGSRGTSNTSLNFGPLARVLSELGPEHFDSDLHRRVREHLIDPTPPADEELLPTFAELDALSAVHGIDEETAKQLLLRLRERGLSRELERADEALLPELQHKLAEIRTRIREFA